jgi:hypothetical protein
MYFRDTLMPKRDHEAQIAIIENHATLTSYFVKDPAAQLVAMHGTDDQTHDQADSTDKQNQTAQAKSSPAPSACDDRSFG